MGSAGVGLWWNVLQERVYDAEWQSKVTQCASVYAWVPPRFCIQICFVKPITPTPCPEPAPSKGESAQRHPTTLAAGARLASTGPSALHAPRARPFRLGLRFFNLAAVKWRRSLVLLHAGCRALRPKPPCRSHLKRQQCQINGRAHHRRCPRAQRAQSAAAFIALGLPAPACWSWRLRLCWHSLQRCGQHAAATRHFATRQADE